MNPRNLSVTCHPRDIMEMANFNPNMKTPKWAKEQAEWDRERTRNVELQNPINRVIPRPHGYAPGDLVTINTRISPFYGAIGEVLMSYPPGAIHEREGEVQVLLKGESGTQFVSRYLWSDVRRYDVAETVREGER